MSNHDPIHSIVTIDFLPPRFREESARRKADAWRALVVALFISLILAAGWRQRQTRRTLTAELQLVNEQHAAVETRLHRLTELQGKLNRLQTQAELVTYLQHPWPRTQILAAVVEPLPQAITLNEIRFYQETSVPNPLLAAQPPKPKSERDAQGQLATADPAQHDLEKLRGAQQHRTTVVTLSGVTNDVAALHFYLGKLAEHRLIAKAELRSLERSERGTAGSSLFRARLLVRPPYGWPGGPGAPEREALAPLANHSAHEQPLYADTQ